MLLTKYRLNHAIKKCKKFYKYNKKLGKKSNIYKYSRFVLRNSRFKIDYERAFKMLDNIKLIYNQIDKHWAETDGDFIYINTFKNFTNELLINTIIHESLHYIILREGKHYIPEEKEHYIMYLISKYLII
tara:strand:+ start:2774 stop:3163 length:390 start_codon:yes stop_codon:yes gene_type:complete